MNAQNSIRQIEGSQPLKRVPGNRVVHNLNGQRLGRKGLITRARILEAARNLIDERDDLQISLSAVATEAALGMTSLYNYFGDLTDVILALLDEVMLEADAAYLASMRRRWDDDLLPEECRKFVFSFFEFWSKNANIYHLRNLYADNRDPKMITHRVPVAEEMIGLIVFQMDGHVLARDDWSNSMASAVFMGIERAISVLTNPHLLRDLPSDLRPDRQGLLLAEAELFEFALRTKRALNTQT